MVNSLSIFLAPFFWPHAYSENRSLSRYAKFGLLCIVPVAVLWRSIAETISLSIHNDAYTHILLILPISVALICLEWNRIKPSTAEGSRTGLYIFAFGIVLVVLDRWLSIGTPDIQLATNMLALVILWISAFMICFGARVPRSLLFPLCFLFWLVPMPTFLLTGIVRWLQHGSAFATSLLFSVSGVPAVRDGLLVSIPGLTVEVAKECSSIRSSMMLLVTTMVLAHVLLKTTWRKALLILSAVPLSVAKNGLRIFTIAMLGTRVNRSFLSGHLHHDGGIVFLLLALIVIGMLLGVLRKGERATATKISAHPIANHISNFVVDGPAN